jgi:hypothetical protein
VTLDPTVLDMVEANRREWVVRVDGRWSRRGLAYGTTPRWYFVKPNGNWWSITEYETDEDTHWSGEMRWDLESNEEFRLASDPVTTGELVHVAHAPQEVQFWVAGFRADVAEISATRDDGGRQANLTGWSA